jgi:hypothetical protein
MRSSKTLTKYEIQKEINRIARQKFVSHYNRYFDQEQPPNIEKPEKPKKP